MEKQHVLIVEDNIIEAQFIRQMIRQLGYGIQAITRSGDEAILLTRHLDPDLVLLDLDLDQGLDPLAVSRKIKARNSIPVIFTSNFIYKANWPSVSGARHDGFLLKPFTISELEVVVGRVQTTPTGAYRVKPDRSHLALRSA